MAEKYIVTGEMAYIRRSDQTEDVRYKGSLIPGGDLDPANLQHLLSVKLVEPLAEAVEPVAVVADDGQPVTLEREAVDEAEAERRDVVGSTPQDAEELDGMTVAELKLYAERHGIELAGATKKDEILAAVRTAVR